MNEPLTKFRPGEWVISLSYLSRACSFLTGGITVAILLYRAKVSGLHIFAGGALGAISSLGAGGLFARVFYPVRPGHMFVVRRMPSALPMTLTAALIPSLSMGLLSAAVAANLGYTPLNTGIFLGALVATSIGGLIGSGSALIK
jgi:hypothetical protein